MSTAAIPGTLERAERPFGTRDKIGYLFGDWGNDFTFLMVSTYLMVFYTNVAHLKATDVGTLFLFVRVADAFLDVFWGRLIDTWKPSAAGRFRPWIRRMAIPVGVAACLLYMTSMRDWPYGARLAYAAATYFLWSAMYTTINIPYGSMASVMSDEPSDRSRLSTYRSLGATIAGLFVALVPPFFIYTKVAGKSQVVPGKFALTAALFAALAVVFYFACHSLVRERVEARPRPADASFGRLIGSLVTSRPLIGLMLANLSLLFALLFSGSMAPYLWLYHFNNGSMSAYANLANSLPALLLFPVAATVGSRFGKKEIAAVGALITGLIYILMYFLHLTNAWAFILLSVVAGFGVGLFNMLVWALITDVIDHEEVRTGERNDGVVYAVNTWARKLGQAIAGGIGAYALAAVGFQSGSTTQSSGTVHGIYMFATLIPGLLYLLVSFWLFVLYPLSRSKVTEEAEVLRLRREQRAAAVPVN